jgi:hypothetical protein
VPSITEPLHQHGGWTIKMLTFKHALTALPDAKPVGNGEYTCCCPAHQETNPSFTFRAGKDGGLVPCCHAGCTADAIVKAIRQRMIDNGITVVDYANSNKLPVKFLVGYYGMFDEPKGNGGPRRVVFTYIDDNIVEVATKVRFTVDSHDTFWEEAPATGKKRILPYGLWLPKSIPYTGFTDYLVLCEGESDQQTFTYHQIRALGIGGSNGWKKEYADLPTIKRATKIFVIKEPDTKQPNLFAAKVCADLPRALVVEMSATGFKDPGEMYQHDPANFLKVWSAAMSTAQPMPEQVNPEDVVEVNNWPEPPAAEAFAGIAGDFVKMWEPHTEADTAALLAQFLAFVGHAVGRRPFFAVGGDDHHTNIFPLLVGPTSYGRKGQSYGCVAHTFERVTIKGGHGAYDENVVQKTFNDASGLSSGEGLISAVRDARYEPDEKTGAPTLVDKGVVDKRLLVFEPEFASPLRRMARDGNTLSETVRQSWDSGKLGTMTRTAPLRATDAHISIIAHITRADLSLYLNDISAVNGFANRFVFLATRRTKLLANPGRPTMETIGAMAARIAGVIEFGQTVGAMQRSPEAEVLWEQIYQQASEPRTGRQHNAVVSRSAPQMVRLSMIYALLDKSPVINISHLRSAKALWDYAEATSRFVFGNRLGDKLAEQILGLLKANPAGLTTREIIAKVYDKKHVHDSLRLLLDNDQVVESKTPKGHGQLWKVR